MKKELTKKLELIGGLLVKCDKSITCYEFIDKFKKELIDNQISIDKINSVNASLSALALKGYATKNKGLYNEKIATYYLASTSLVEYVNSLENE